MEEENHIIVGLNRRLDRTLESLVAGSLNPAVEIGGLGLQEAGGMLSFAKRSEEDMKNLLIENVDPFRLIVDWWNYEIRRDYLIRFSGFYTINGTYYEVNGDHHYVEINPTTEFDSSGKCYLVLKLDGSTGASFITMTSGILNTRHDLAIIGEVHAFKENGTDYISRIKIKKYNIGVPALLYTM